MKKSKVFIRSTVLLVLMAMMTVVLTSCSKTAATTESFKALASEKGFIVEDAAGQFAEYDNIKEVTITAPQDRSYQIEFYVMSDSSYAKSFFENNKAKFELSKSSDFSESSNSGDNFAGYTLECNDKYMFVEYVDTTVVYINTDKANKDAVTEFIKELDY